MGGIRDGWKFNAKWVIEVRSTIFPILMKKTILLCITSSILLLWYISHAKILESGCSDFMTQKECDTYLKIKESYKTNGVWYLWYSSINAFTKTLRSKRKKKDFAYIKKYGSSKNFIKKIDEKIVYYEKKERKTIYAMNTFYNYIGKKYWWWAGSEVSNFDAPWSLLTTEQLSIQKNIIKQLDNAINGNIKECESSNNTIDASLNDFMNQSHGLHLNYSNWQVNYINLEPLNDTVVKSYLFFRFPSNYATQFLFADIFLNNGRLVEIDTIYGSGSKEKFYSWSFASWNFIHFNSPSTQALFNNIFNTATNYLPSSWTEKNRKIYYSLNCKNIYAYFNNKPELCSAPEINLTIAQSTSEQIIQACKTTIELTNKLYQKK